MILSPRSLVLLSICCCCWGWGQGQGWWLDAVAGLLRGAAVLTPSPSPTGDPIPDTQDVDLAHRMNSSSQASILLGSFLSDHLYRDGWPRVEDLIQRRACGTQQTKLSFSYCFGSKERHLPSPTLVLVYPECPAEGSRMGLPGFTVLVLWVTKPWAPLPQSQLLLPWPVVPVKGFHKS